MVALPLLLVQVPPATVLARVVVRPAQTLAVPVMAAGIWFTVTTVVALQPADVRVMIVVPAATPVTTPVLEFTVATLVVPLLHTPLEMSLSDVVDVSHTLVVPVIAPGAAFMVIAFVTTQPDPVVYVIVAAPAATPVAEPVELFIIATSVLLELHVPPLVELVYVADVPAQKDVDPPIAAGTGLTVIVVVADVAVGVVIHK
jgi:hypothetical protein